MININSKIVVIGLGYVGYPLFSQFSKYYSNVYGIDTKEKLPEIIKKSSKNNASNIISDYSILNDADYIFVCVPTPINKDNIPDISILEEVSNNISKNLSNKKQIIIYESTVYPTCTDNLYKKYFENRENTYVVFSPERVCPGISKKQLKDLTKLVGSEDEAIRNEICELYNSVNIKTFPVKSTVIAECSKLLENIQRDVNIALMNEFAYVCSKADINFTEVLEAAYTKEGFSKYKPGMVGGHCISVDPYYFTHWLDNIDIHEHAFISESRETNEQTIIRIGQDILEKLKDCKNIAILGMTYKENVADIRTSGSIKLYNYLKEHTDKNIICHDPLVKQYKISFSKIDQCDGIVLAVPHKWYSKKINLLKEKSVYDIKCAYTDYEFKNYYGFGYC